MKSADHFSLFGELSWVNAYGHKKFTNSVSKQSAQTVSYTEPTTLSAGVMIEPSALTPRGPSRIVVNWPRQISWGHFSIGTIRFPCAAVTLRSSYPTAPTIRSATGIVM